jgi:hypothetical protein
MIKNPSYSGKVRINEEKNPGMKTTRNPHAVDNVNQSQGPRTGNMSARDGKRKTFVDDKQQRAPLADVIANAYSARGTDLADHYRPSLEGISPNTKARFRRA